MKFVYKILLWTIIIMAAAFGLSGYLFVNSVFETSLEREVSQAMDDSSILRFAFETAALNIPTKYNVLQDTAVEQIGSRLESSGQGSGRFLRLSNEEKKVLFVSNGFPEDTALLQQITEDTRIWQVIPLGEHYYIHTGIMVNALDRNMYLETLEDVTEVFEERTLGFSVYRQVTLAMLLCSSVIMFLICTWLTKPIRFLTHATRKMAGGDYSYRARQISSDELGQLTMDFNSMANELEATIGELREEVRAREDFIAAFAHELKTPLTAIIGYADLLRSRKLDEEKHFLSANYIYTEGKRLENMSFRLLDIIVTKRDTIERQPIAAKSLFDYLKSMFSGNTEQKLRISFGKGTVYAEGNLLKSVLLNLVDNACKASSEGGLVEVYGKRRENAYAFCVKDYGVGIPEEELKKVTEAFYMVDKSRSRSKNGAGLGLALCVEILRLHESELLIESKVGEGTIISFEIPDRQEEEPGRAEENRQNTESGRKAESAREEEGSRKEECRREMEVAGKEECDRKTENGRTAQEGERKGGIDEAEKDNGRTEQGGKGAEPDEFKEMGQT
ncbi:Alkaline phosphatase synthesis sensor protein PhoR [Acetatifactor muris]|uniref:histidine kinase n=1 Tax=Acetatifactor muris TaxID=879566 RepID=A0A2K4ZK84_9FIRM|nr:HAMP domain-containing sensor histidine kinase [Acetatifactor muris]SOY30870.1 Alkaline phosphatase synthesis sensor protein PhoR [Acetatifactor muris]